MIAATSRSGHAVAERQTASAASTHLSRQTKIRFDDFKRHSGTGEATETAVRDYLVAKKHMRPEVLGTVRVAEKMQQTSDGIFVRVEHAPIQKGRVVMPLASPFVIVDVMTEHDISQRDAQALWGRYLQAVANMLGVKLDESCKDVSRAFYWARHPAGQDHYAKHVQGQALDLSTIKVDSDPATSRTGKARPVIGAGATAIGNTSFSFPVSQELKTFAKKYGPYFRLADALEDEASDRVRGTTSSVTGLVVECPFDEFHSNAGDSSDKACFVMNASDTEHGNFVWACQHANCKERDRLEFLAKALADEWLSAAILYEPDNIDAPPDPCVVGRTSAADLTSESPLENVERVLRLAAECDDLLVRAQC